MEQHESFGQRINKLDSSTWTAGEWSTFRLYKEVHMYKGMEYMGMDREGLEYWKNAKGDVYRGNKELNFYCVAGRWVWADYFKPLN